MTASITLTNAKRGPPGRRSAQRPPEQVEISFSECVREIEQAMSEIVRLDSVMCDIEKQLNDIDIASDDPWDVIENEGKVDRLHTAHGQSETMLVCEVNAVIWFGGMLLDQWHDAKFTRIARRFSAFDRFYQRVESCWPRVAADPVWMRLRSEGVPF